ncbi:MAG: hypothetical protein Q9180_005953 [Flavoplaca navasiana]
MLGGSSGINYRRLVFALRVDLDDWEVLSNTGWNYESMAPYYRKFEIFQVARPEQEAAGLNSFINENAQGRWYFVVGRRSGVSPAIDIGKPFASRPNLHTVTGAVVDNIIFSSDTTGDLVATELNFTANNQSFIANASREVIISGGMIKSPQMLELSDIGDAKLLESSGIETLIDNPHVGENLQDHPQCKVPSIPAEGELTFDDVYNGNWTAFWTNLYQEKGKGQLARLVVSPIQRSFHGTRSSHKNSKINLES